MKVMGKSGISCCCLLVCNWLHDSIARLQVLFHRSVLPVCQEIQGGSGAV